MKRIFCLLAAAVVVFLGSLPVHAATEEEPSIQPDPVELLAVQDVDPAADGARGDLISAIRSVFGEYQPRTYTVTTYLSDGSTVTSTEIVSGLAGLDYEWLAGVLLFALALFSLFRLIGGLLKS